MHNLGCDNAYPKVSRLVTEFIGLVLTFNKFEYELWKLHMISDILWNNRWLKIEVTARHGVSLIKFKVLFRSKYSSAGVMRRELWRFPDPITNECGCLWTISNVSSVSNTAAVSTLDLFWINWKTHGWGRSRFQLKLSRVLWLWVKTLLNRTYFETVVWLLCFAMT